MKFGKNQKIKFHSSNGAYSVVTQRENEDSQITATDEEAQLLLSFFGKSNIQEGNVKSDPRKSKKEFKLYSSGSMIILNLVFPKPNQTELRLYLSKKAGFKPNSNDIWFIFEKNSELWIGSMDETEWRSQNKLLIYDEGEGDYQNAIQELDETKISELIARDVYHRDRKLAITRMEQSGYLCEYNKDHRLFLSHSTKNPYLESHHMIPISLQKEFEIPLDTLDNIYCLCPHCHRAIHYAVKDVTKEIIEKLVQKRPDVLRILNDNIEDIFSYYAVETIE